MPTLLERIKTVASGLFRSPLVFFVKSTASLFTSGLRQASAEHDPAGNYAGWVYAAVSKRARRVAAIQLKLYDLRGKELVEVEDDEILSLLDRVNGIQDRYQFFYTIELFLCLWGRAPILKDRAGGRRVLQLWPLRPDLLHAEKDREGNVTGYVYRVGITSQTYAVDDIIFVREPSPRSLVDGHSPVAAASLEIDTDVAAAVWNKHLLDNFAEPGTVLQTEGKIDEAKAKQIIKAWKKRHAGPQNAGAVTILDRGLTYAAAGRSPEELQLNETRKTNRNAIVAILGVPMSLMTSEDVNLANAEVGERIFAKDTIEPQMRLITGALNEFLIAEMAPSKWLDFESPVPEDVQQKINVASAGEGRWLTVNDAREMFGLEPLEGGEYIFKPFGVMPQVGGGIDPTDGGGAPAMEPAATEPAKGYAVLPVRKGANFMSRKHREIKRRILARSWLKRTITQGIAEKVTAAILAVTKATPDEAGRVKVTIKNAKAVAVKADGSPVDDKPELDARLKTERLEFLAKLPRYRQAMRKDVRRFFSEQEDEVLKNLEDEGIPKGKKTNVGNWINRILFAKVGADKILIELAARHALTNIQAGAEDIQKLMGTPGGGVIGTPFVHDYIAKRSAAMLLVNETTRKKLQDQLREAIDAGEDLGQVRDRVSKVYHEAEGFRAETIARTEVGMAQNFGRNEEMRQAGSERKVWIATFSNTRDAHAEADGQVVKVSDSFSVDGEELAYPGDAGGSPENVINCQCSVSPTLEDLT